ncbi:MAG: response regulator transcription factor [Campylobacterales bacterium]|nr:response regulator transcription factor [Campylobacterales bacterium]
MNILIVEDDRDLCDTLYEALCTKGFKVSQSYNGSEAVDLLYERSYEMLILDINLPGLNGFEILKEARSYYPHIAALFMTALDTPEHMEKSFENGGDDYIRKPFKILELFYRIDAITKRLYSLQSVVVQIAPDISYDITKRKLLQNHTEIILKPKLSALLHILTTHAGQIVSREEIEMNLWEGEDLPDRAILRIYIRELRALLGEEAISTLRGVGYKLETYRA